MNKQNEIEIELINFLGGGNPSSNQKSFSALEASLVLYTEKEKQKKRHQYIVQFCDLIRKSGVEIHTRLLITLMERASERGWFNIPTRIKETLLQIQLLGMDLELKYQVSNFSHALIEYGFGFKDKLNIDGQPEFITSPHVFEQKPELASAIGYGLLSILPEYENVQTADGLLILDNTDALEVFLTITGQHYFSLEEGEGMMPLTYIQEVLENAFLLWLVEVN